MNDHTESPVSFRETVRDIIFEADTPTGKPFDVLLTSTTAEAGAPPSGTTGDPRWQAPITTSGLPAVSLPSGLTPNGLNEGGRNPAGLPLAVQLIARPMDEGGLLSAAEWVETVLDFTATPSLN